ncbi:MAG: tyrosine-type recombinase/integrase [Alphaproteobacteria bacterium]|nr:tyrosine-type recombinase/integrase [Alphaproteobacteria bacterium]
MPITDTSVRNAKPTDKPYKLHDTDGLFVLVHPNGSRYWRLKYRFLGKEKLLALGVYPEVSLGEARERRSQARKLLASGTDPGEIKKAAKRQAILNSETTFEAVAREWHDHFKHKWTPQVVASSMRRLENHMFPKLGSRPIADITPPELLSVVRIVERTGALDMAQRVMQLTGQVFTYAIATGRAQRNPVNDLRGALKPPVRKHMAHFKEDELPEYLQRLENFTGNLQTKLALKFLLLTFVRTGELRGAEWTEINFDKAEWRIPAERMKMREQHIVPLSTHAIAVLRDLQARTGNRQFVFPNQHKPMGCMSENTILFALYDMGYRFKATGHGFRATASTILNENGFAPDVIERQLAHGERNKVRAAYNHAQYLAERRKMMQWWGDYVERTSRSEQRS